MGEISPATPEDRAAFRRSLREEANDLLRTRVPDPEDPETWAFGGPEDFSGTMPDLPADQGAAEETADDDLR